MWVGGAGVAGEEAVGITVLLDRHSTPDGDIGVGACRKHLVDIDLLCGTAQSRQPLLAERGTFFFLQCPIGISKRIETKMI